jgi:hypothetical protein
VREALLFTGFPGFAAGRRAPQKEPVSNDWGGKVATKMFSFLDRVAANCDLPAKLLIQPDANEQFERVDCALAATKKVSGLPPIGFVEIGCYVGRRC